MAKKASTQDRVERARRKLAKATLKLHVAEEKHVQTRAIGKQEVEKVRLRAARRQARAAEQVERRTAAVAKAQKRLLDLTTPDTVATDDAAAEPAAPESPLGVPLSATTADVISTDQLGVNGDENEVGFVASEGKLVLPEQSTDIDA